MAQQVVVIHGGNEFSSYEEYLAHLKELRIESVAYFKGRRDWRDTLQDSLGSGYEVIAPQMPNRKNAKYIEWKVWFEKLTPFLDHGVVLIGHSLGATFLAKYLSEEGFPKITTATFLVSGPYDMDGDRPIVEFALPHTLLFLEQQGGDIFLYHSDDDPTVPFGELAKYEQALPQARANILKDRGHIRQEYFPELVADIRALC